MTRRLIPVCFAALLVACGGTATESTEGATASEATAGATSDAPTTAEVPTTAASAPSSDSTAANATPARDVPEALRFEAPLVGGGTIDVASLAGGPVLLWFWAPF